VSEIGVECSVAARGWLALVRVSDRGSSSQFEVGVSATELTHFDPGATDPDALVRRSFEFLLAREPKESIMPAFSLSVIARYFPEFESVIRSGSSGYQRGVDRL
jgi:hypothetical protein